MIEDRAEDSSFWVYILRNPMGRFYVGQTDDLGMRLESHNRTDSINGKYTRKNGPWVLIWKEGHPNRGSAMHREQEIKNWKSARMIRVRLLGEPE
jgi:putative endonuclease